MHFKNIETKQLVVSENKFSLDKSLIYLFKTNPFFSIIYNKIPKIIYDDPEDSNVAYLKYNIQKSKFTIGLNRAFMKDLSTEGIAFVIEHEIMHFLLKHIYRKIDKTLTKEESSLLIVCEDIAMHELMGRERADLYDSWTVNFYNNKIASTFNLPTLEYNQTVEHYFNLLNSHPNSKELKEALSKKDKPCWYPKMTDDHDHQEFTPQEQEMMEMLTKNLIDKSMAEAKRNNVVINNETLKQMLEKLIEPPPKLTSVTARQMVRSFVLNTIKTNKERTYRHYNPKSKILEKVLNKAIVKGSKTNKTSSIVVLVDESGSVDDSLFEKFMQYLIALQKYVELRIIHFDTEINSEYVFKYGKKQYQFKSKRTGYGGTVVEKALDKAISLNPNGMIVLTDGYLYDNIIVNKPKVPTIWGVPKNGDLKIHEKMQFGKIVIIE